MVARLLRWCLQTVLDCSNTSSRCHGSILSCFAAGKQRNGRCNDPTLLGSLELCRSTYFDSTCILTLSISRIVHQRLSIALTRT
jgi:hypothetical protein